MKSLLILILVFAFNACSTVDGVAEDLGFRDAEIQTLQDEITSLTTQLSDKQNEIEMLEMELQDAVDENERLLVQNEIDQLNQDKVELEIALAEATSAEEIDG